MHCFKKFFCRLFPVIFASSGFLLSNKAPSQEKTAFKLEVLTAESGTGQIRDVIWGFDFLDKDRIIFTEREGKIKILNLKDKKITEITNVPRVWARGQGGLLDIRVHYKNPNKVFFTYAEPVDKGATTALSVADIKDGALVNIKKLITTKTESSNTIHFGSRIEFDQKGHIFITVGDRNDRPRVQSLEYHNGKILRLNEDGTVPKDNPFIKTPKAQPEIWSLGHRSPQGLVYDLKNDRLWLSEMGPRGGDEINLIESKKNYGWPVVTYGKEYSGFKVGDGLQKKEGMQEPIAYWAPSISPSGMALYTGDQFPQWQGHLFVGTLSGQHLRRLVIQDTKITEQEELLKDKDYRVRQVRSGPDGALYFSTDSGVIGRLVSK